MPPYFNMQESAARRTDRARTAQVRRLSERTFEEFVLLCAKANHESRRWNPPPSFYWDKMHLDRDLIWIAESAGRLVGFVEGGWLRVASREVDIVQIYVAHEFRSTRTAENLCRSFLRVFKRRRFGSIWVTNVDRNREGFYRQFGFIKFSRKSLVLKMAHPESQ